MHTWKAFLDSLDTPGGHIFILVILVAALGVALTVGASIAEAFMAAAFTALMVVLRGQKRNNGA